MTYRYFLWSKRVGNSILKPFAVLKVFVGSPTISILERLLSDSSQQNLWVLFALRLYFLGYNVALPPIWDHKGHINDFWLSDNNSIVSEIPTEDIDNWMQNYPVFNF